MPALRAATRDLTLVRGLGADDCAPLRAELGTWWREFVAARFDRAIRARSRDQALSGLIVRHLATGLSDASLWVPVDEAGAQIAPLEERSRKIARRYEKVEPDLALETKTYADVLLTLFGLSGGMPTVLSLQRSRFAEALTKLGVADADVRRLAPAS